MNHVVLLLLLAPLWAQSDLERQQERQAREQAARQQQEAIRTQELNAENQSLLRDAAQQRLDVLAQQYQSAVAYGGTPSERAALQQQMRDQQASLRSIEQRQNLTAQQLQDEIDRLRTNLSKANAAGLLSAYAIQQRELVIQKHVAELEQMRSERQVNAGARTLAERQQTAAPDQAERTQQARSLLASASKQGQLAVSEIEGRRLRLEQALAKVASSRTDPQRGIVVTLPGPLFVAGSARLTSGAHTSLDAIARILVANSPLVITVEGYTDNVGSTSANLRFSEARAKAVSNYLMGAGVSGQHLTAVGEGEANTVAPNTTEAGRQQNSRVEIVIAP